MKTNPAPLTTQEIVESAGAKGPSFLSKEILVGRVIPVAVLAFLGLTLHLLPWSHVTWHQ